MEYEFPFEATVTVSRFKNCEPEELEATVICGLTPEVKAVTNRDPEYCSPGEPASSSLHSIIAVETGEDLTDLVSDDEVERL